MGRAARHKRSPTLAYMLENACRALIYINPPHDLYPVQRELVANAKSNETYGNLKSYGNRNFDQSEGMKVMGRSAHHRVIL